MNHSRLLSILAILLLSTIAISCGDDNDEPSVPDYQTSLQGSWSRISDTGTTFEFKEITFRPGGLATAVYTDDSSLAPDEGASGEITKTLAYTINGSELRIYQGPTATGQYTVGKMTFFNDGTMSYLYHSSTSSATFNLELRKK